MAWQDEFGPDYAVPAEIEALVAAGTLEDTSWHNDVCPSFMLAPTSPDMDAPRLWVEHPDQNRREFVEAAGRFVVDGANVTVDYANIYEGDDLTAALAALGVL